MMVELVLRISAMLSLVGISAISLYCSVHFFRLWRKFREESLFHLCILCFGLIIYFLFIAAMVLIGTEKATMVNIAKRTVGIIYSFLCLETSLFYLSAFSNRRGLLEKYIPFMLGITFGMALALIGMQDSNPWFETVLVIEYYLPFVFMLGLLIRISHTTIEVLRDEQISNEDKQFMKVLLIAAIAMFLSAIGDLIFFGIMMFISADFWDSLIVISGIIGPFLAIMFLYLVKRLFEDIDQADVLHLMNLLS